MPITKEELKEFFAEEENAGVFREIAKDAGYEAKEDVEGLVTKKNDLLGQLSRIKKDRDQYKNALDSVDLDGYKEYQDKSVENQTNSERALRELTKANTDLKTTQESYSKLERDFNETLIISDLTRTLQKSGVDPVHIPILTSAFKGQAKVEVEDNSRVVVLDSGSQGHQTTGEFFKTWAESDQGKAYLIKPENSGAQSQRIAPTETQIGKLGSTVQESLTNAQPKN